MKLVMSESESQQEISSIIVQEDLTIWIHLRKDPMFPQMIADGAVIHIMASLDSI